MFAHMATIGEVISGIQSLLKTNGVFVFENHYLGNVIDNLQYDTFYHEHLRTYSAMPLKKLFEYYKLNKFAKSYLEIGCGEGIDLKYIINNFNLFFLF